MEAGGMGDAVIDSHEDVAMDLVRLGALNVG